MHNDVNSNPLYYEKIHKLLFKFATPSISIYSQLHHLQSLEHILNDPNTQRTKTKGEIIKLVSAYNSVLLLLQEFGQCSDKHTLQSSNYLTQTPLLESQNRF